MVLLDVLAQATDKPTRRGRRQTRSGSRRRFRSSRRGSSEVVGAIMLFGLVMASIMTVQVLAVPGWNADEEHLHAQRVQDELVSLDERALYSATTGTTQRVNVETTITYPSRFLFLSPGPATGAVSTSASANATLVNLTALDGSVEFFDGSNKVYETESLSYTPMYAYLEDQTETIYEGTVLYTVHDTGYEQVLRQNLVSGNQIHIMILDTNVAAITPETPIDIVPQSVAVRATPVTGVSGAPIEVTLPTQLSKEAWERALEDEMVANGGYVLNMTYVAPAEGSDIGFITVQFDGTATYDLRVSKVGLNTPSETQVPVYLAVVEGDNGHIPESGSTIVTLEARDEFNNPVAGVPVTIADNGTTPLGGTVEVRSKPGSTTVRTDSDGRATFVYTAPDSIVYGIIEDDTLNFSVTDVGQTVTYDSADVEMEVWDTAGRAADFIISEGRVIFTEEATGFVTVVGTAFTDGASGPNLPVFVDVMIDGVVEDPWNADVNNGGNPRSFYFSALPAGTEITVEGEAPTGGIGREVISTEDSSQVIVLRDGDPVPNYDGLGDQDDVETFLQDYTDYSDPDDPRMKLAENQAIFLFELGSTNTGSSTFDMQDLVVLVTLQTA